MLFFVFIFSTLQLRSNCKENALQVQKNVLIVLDALMFLLHSI